MSPWKILDNSFFHLTYNSVNKNYRLGWFWKGRIYYIIIKFSFHTIDLVDDGLYPKERERYIKEGYSGIACQSVQSVHLRGNSYRLACEEYAKALKQKSYSKSNYKQAEILCSNY